MYDLYSIPTLSYRCAAHSSDGALKRLARSKIMCVLEAVELYESLSLVLKYFSYSIKNKKALNSPMKLLNMTLKHLQHGAIHKWLIFRMPARE